MYPYNSNSMFEPMYKPRGGFRGSPRGGRGRGGGGWGNQGGGGGYYGGGGQMDGFRGGRGGGGGGYRGAGLTYSPTGRGAGANTGGGYRNNDSGYRGGGGYRGGYRGGMQQQGGYGAAPRGGGYHTGGYQGQRGGRGAMGGGYRGGQNYRGGMEQPRGGQMNKNRGNTHTTFRKSDVTVFEESLDLDRRRRMVKLSFDNKIQRADFEYLLQTEGVADVHISGHLIADYKEEDEDAMLTAFQEAEQITQNGIPCYADLTGKRSKNFGKEGVKDLKRVDVRNLPEKTSLDTVKEAFPAATAVWKNHKFNFIELLFANEEEACEAILSGQQKEINGVLPYVMFHRENQADLSKRPREDDTTPQPAAKKVKKDVEVEADKENGQGEEEEADDDENGGGDEEEEAADEEADE